MNLSSDGEHWIDVYGNLTVLGSLITAYNTSNNYYIRVFSGAKLRIENGEISYAGYTSNGDKTGLWINTENATIQNTTIHNNYHGIHLYKANNTLIANNTIQNNNWAGVYLWRSSGNTIANNTFWSDGLFVWGSYNNTVVGNTVNGKPLVYMERADGVTIDWPAGQIVLVACKNIVIKNQNISNIDTGIELWNTNNTIIRDSTIQSNDFGAYLDSSSGNTIANNTIRNNRYAIYLWGSSNNIICFNDFINNTYLTNSWGGALWVTPSNVSYTYSGNTYENTLGNYWSDYTGSDPDGDGVGNETFGGDTHPLMSPIENYWIPDTDYDDLNNL